MNSDSKRSLVLFFTLLGFAATGQSVEKIKLELANIQAIPEAHEFLDSHAGIKGEVIEIKSGTDTTLLDQELLSSNKGDVLDFDSEDKKTHVFFKTLSITYVNSFRVQYIYLDNRRLTINKIDSLRKIILTRVNKGEQFQQLAREYSMDGNSKNGGDLGWFEEGQMHVDFENNVKKRRLGEVYTVDIPANRWYYVVKNSHDRRVDKKVTLLRVEINNQ